MNTVHEFLTELHSFPRYEQEQVWASFRSGNVATAVAKLQAYIDDRKVEQSDQTKNEMQNDQAALRYGHFENKKPMCHEPIDSVFNGSRSTIGEEVKRGQFVLPPYITREVRPGYYWIRSANPQYANRTFLAELDEDKCWRYMGVSGSDSYFINKIVKGPIECGTLRHDNA